MTECKQELMKTGLPYPRTCPICRLGPCQRGEMANANQSEGSDEVDILAICGTDAHKWAKEFCKRYPSAQSQIKGQEGQVDGDEFEAVMIGWFANAIMNTHDIITGQGPVVLPDGSAAFVGTVNTDS